MDDKKDCGTSEGKTEDTSEDKQSTSSNDVECTICLQPIVQPVVLPCKHSFCFLCVKGLIHQNNKCALCRRAIPKRYLNNPQLSVPGGSASGDNLHKWFYKGKNGWWQYDEQTCEVIETAYLQNEEQCEVLIAGLLYTIDLQNNVQFQKLNPSCRRRITRGHTTFSNKGVAGMHQMHDNRTSNSSTDSRSSCDRCRDNATPCAKTRRLVVILPRIDAPGIQITLNNRRLPPYDHFGASHSNANMSDNQTTSRQNVKIVSGATAGEVNDNSAQQPLAESVSDPPNISNTSASGASRSSDEVLPESLTRKNDDLTALPSSKKVRRGAVFMSLITRTNPVDFGNSVASKLHQMSYGQRQYCERIINDALFKGLEGQLSESSTIM